MKRVENEAERARRYSEALVTASLKVRPAVEWPAGLGHRPTIPGWWGAQLSLATGAAPVVRPRRPAERLAAFPASTQRIFKPRGCAKRVILE